MQRLFHYILIHKIQGPLKHLTFSTALHIKTVNIPVNKNAHQTQFPATPFVRTISVTKFGVSAEKVVATIEIPNNHQGIFLPDKKNSVIFLPDFLETIIPIKREITKNEAIISQSILFNCIVKLLS